MVLRAFLEKCVFWKQARVAGRGGLRRVFILKNDLFKNFESLFVAQTDIFWLKQTKTDNFFEWIPLKVSHALT